METPASMARLDTRCPPPKQVERISADGIWKRLPITEVDSDPEEGAHGTAMPAEAPTLWEPTPAMSISTKSKPTTKSRDLTNHNPYGTSVTLGMSDFVQDAITHYVNVTKSDREPKLAQTPFCPPGSLLASDWETVGELEKGCHSVVMKNMWVARTARPDLIKPCNDLAAHLHKWSRNCDKYIARTVGYMRRSKNFTLKGYVGDPLWDCELWLFVDADFCGEVEHTKSTSGCWLVLVGYRLVRREARVHCPLHY